MKKFMILTLFTVGVIFFFVSINMDYFQKSKIAVVGNTFSQIGCLKNHLIAYKNDFGDYPTHLNDLMKSGYVLNKNDIQYFDVTESKYMSWIYLPQSIELSGQKLIVLSPVLFNDKNSEIKFSEENSQRVALLDSGSIILIEDKRLCFGRY